MSSGCINRVILADRGSTQIPAAPAARSTGAAKAIRWQSISSTERKSTVHGTSARPSDLVPSATKAASAHADFRRSMRVEGKHSCCNFYTSPTRSACSLEMKNCGRLGCAAALMRAKATWETQVRCCARETCCTDSGRCKRRARLTTRPRCCTKNLIAVSPTLIARARLPAGVAFSYAFHQDQHRVASSFLRGGAKRGAVV